MTTERLCKQCLRWLPDEAFQKGALNRSGKPYIRHVCKTCVNFRRAIQRQSPKPVRGERRVCKKCRVEKPLAAFYMNSDGGRQWTCKACHGAIKQARIAAMRTNDPAAYAEHNRKAASAQAKRIARRAVQKVLGARRA